MTGDRLSLHSSFMRRNACRVKPEQWIDWPDIFPDGYIFNYERAVAAFCWPSRRVANAPSKCTPRILFLSGFPFTTCLSCACYLRLFTARHSCLINKLQLIAHAAAERIIRQSSASQLGYVRPVLISATLHIQWIGSISNQIKRSLSFLANRDLIWNGNEVPKAIPCAFFGTAWTFKRISKRITRHSRSENESAKLER